MKRRILTVISALGLALILSSCAELIYEPTEVEQAEMQAVRPSAQARPRNTQGGALSTTDTADDVPCISDMRHLES